MFQVFFTLLLLLTLQCNQIHTKNISNETTTTTKIPEKLVTSNVNQERLTILLCEQRDKPYFLPHKSNISQFYVCVKGQLFLLNCPSGYRFDEEHNQCVHKTIENATKQKPNKPVLTPHETNCGWYYVEREATGERVLNSCPMPQLFDISTFECKNYTEVKCKDRFEPKDACDYQIRSAAHSYPCSYLPSCKNRPDGLYPDRLRDCRMYFRCTSERSSESYSCSQHILPFGERFSFEEQRCLPAQFVECINDQQKPMI
ncbi:unnamed protein product [Adineta ricciae]|uniref:Chitin-binding type-2 domain-containing protein n=1 Tax=Adineta ricciae TaxID=249248 RepID=A0A814ASK9_ADIRI|nr:unnamed protein product [Adineta ricciae]CAF0941346.1 unnamed protein product [Adineta ricciae]